MVKRYAFTMIELIFAIVIISIAIVSLPVMTNTTQKGVEQNIVQEAIFAASAQLMGIMSGYWDELSMQDNALSNLSRVINIGGDCDAVTRMRPGHIAQPFHRRCLNNDVNPANLSATGGNFYSLDDAVAAVNGTADIFDNPNASDTGYKDTYTSTATISRTNDLKKIAVSIQDSNGNTITKLISYSANIGEPEYYKRTMQ
ncbi:prepilin-type N-terminal cleavage/methylation domain-containing protein [Sulfurimonas paralvinellae]|uniref:Prepilin-type N-terminal cleavage/methylation domain-containing protein n=1 Tax=Sulfurimonas paralvinellae TaxID=317658 RepID=A0A7M1BC05_9BACT|nr:prepilin-type N-terminal cleavage/methylation domain-containing protein [Sulfurimonas paralvinellae]QOP46348.1 prepilin-type N-terminal cleavage/methylation domain-containing protein [Sulfurimonas paralvinellae]